MELEIKNFIKFIEEKWESADASVDHLQRLVGQQTFAGVLSSLD